MASPQTVFHSKTLRISFSIVKTHLNPLFKTLFIDKLLLTNGLTVSDPTVEFIHALFKTYKFK
ncbi:MAG: hypothetical protein COA79_15635 [Planctomycetota bacterium]|nr:MAG: hypothetical protein COA79_15635 [Planctomycetota bacterium]